MPDITPLQKHSAFFDRDKDGFVSIYDTYSGCRAIGLNPILSFFMIFLINLSMGWATSQSLASHFPRFWEWSNKFVESYLPNMEAEKESKGKKIIPAFQNRGIFPVVFFDLPLLFFCIVWNLIGWAIPVNITSIDLRRVHRGKHGSDTDSYDRNGQFDEEQFEKVFSTFDRDGDGAWTIWDIKDRIIAHRDLLDLPGLIGTTSEFVITFLLAAEGGKLSKEMLKKSYDGSLFYELEKREIAKHTRN